MYESKIVKKTFTETELKKLLCFKTAFCHYSNMGLHGDKDKSVSQIVFDVKNFAEAIYRFVTGESSHIESVLEDMAASIIKEGMDLSVKYSEEENGKGGLVENIEVPEGFER